ncbi:MAG: hypothetical protein ACPGMR_13025 [Pontibacterium sp.]
MSCTYPVPMIPDASVTRWLKITTYEAKVAIHNSLPSCSHSKVGPSTP